MSVAAMTMDDQRPLMNSYDKMSKQYEQTLHGNAGVGGGVGSGVGSGAPPSGPASPTPSGSEELQHAYHHAHHHHAHHHHHHHSRHQQQHVSHMSTSEQQQQQLSPPSLSPPQIQQQQQQQSHNNQYHQTQQQQPATVAEAVAAAEHRQRLLEDEIQNLKLEQVRLSQQCADAQRREKILTRRLANKEQEFQDYVSQIAEYKAAQVPSALALRSALLDPAVNLLFDKLKKELKATKAKLEETQNELSAWKFTPDSNTGKRLMAKCRLLYQENEELGKMTSNGRLAKLETELAMQKSFCEEVKKSQSELDDFLPELDEDVEGMQSTILFLQQELKTTRDRIQTLEKENYQLKNGASGDVGKDTDIEDSGSLPCISQNGSAPETVAIVAEPNATLFNNTNNIIQQQGHNMVAPLNTNELKFAPQPLETIDENACLHNFASPNEIYNGNEEQHTSAGIIAIDDAGSGLNMAITNASVLGVPVVPVVPVVPGVLRTVASRKRNYDSSSNELNENSTPIISPAAVMSHVTAPRTLPPKKSKLRRASVQSIDMNEYDNSAVQIIGGSGIVSVVVPGVPVDPLSIVDNAVVGMANEENPSGVMMEDPLDSNSTVSQRIMTRRRSVRTQQNGAIGGGGGGADSNH